MPGRFVGHRGARDSEWSWERNEGMSESRVSKRPLRAIFAGAVFLAGVAAFAVGLVILLSNGDGDAAPPIVSATATQTVPPTGSPHTTAEPTAPVATATPTPITTASPTATPAPTPTPGPGYTADLSSWSTTESLWITPTHNSSTSDYSEGDLVPFLLQIEGAAPGTTYKVAIAYDCLSSGKHAFDYLGGLQKTNTEPVLTSPGPGSIVPDSALVPPGDPSTTFDDTQDDSLKAWGAVFSAASSPTPQTDCAGTKTVSLSLLAQDRTVSLVWTGHLASGSDWGQGNGAASAAPFEMSVDVNGEVQQSFTMAAGSIN